MNKTFTSGFAVVAALASLSSVQASTAFPGSAPITLVVPFTAGGPTDRVARDLAEALRKTLNTTVLVENAAGAGSSLGTAKVARAKPDGHTLLLNHIGMSTMPALYKNLPFDVRNDFEYLGIINDVPMTLIARPSMPANSYTELAEWVKQNGNKTNLANAGVGSASHLCGMLLQQTWGADMTTVPYSGAAPAITDLMGGQVDVLCDQTTNTSSQISAGKVKAYAVTTNDRLTTPALKHLPTMKEAGAKDFNVTVWHGLYAPKDTPAPVLDTLHKALVTALKDPEFIRKQEGLGAVVANDERVTREGHKAFVEKELNSWGSVIKASGVEPN